jgi:hypothetical protein
MNFDNVTNCYIIINYMLKNTQHIDFQHLKNY